jgi:tetratricopeptide (TPR) repeat protein
MIKASALIELGKEHDALSLINTNLRSDLMAREDFQDLKYEHLFYKGRSLTRLTRCNEALEAFEEAQLIHADGKFETDMLIARSNCLMFLKRYEDAYDAAKRATERDDEDLATLALEYMADSRMMQGRVREALATYIELQRKLPCKHVDEESVRTRINRAVAYLEKHSSQSKPY